MIHSTVTVISTVGTDRVLVRFQRPNLRIETLRVDKESFRSAKPGATGLLEIGKLINSLTFPKTILL